MLLDSIPQGRVLDNSFGALTRHVTRVILFAGTQMMKSDKKIPYSTKELWGKKAQEWDSWIGEEGDQNRRFQSDPILWELAGKIEGHTVLDSGCGTGYLSLQMAEKGAHVIGIDFSAKMIDIARQRAGENPFHIDFRVDSASKLETIQPESIDLVVSNYVLMDLPDLENAVSESHRVLRPRGKMVAVFSHPCFSDPRGPESVEEGSVRYRWDFSYFEEREREGEWGPFSTPFISYHRSLSLYWKTFLSSGFVVTDFREPVVEPPAPTEMSKEQFERYRLLPFSVAFLLEKR
jgi:SAM-dependent methyltransferase